MSFVILLDVLAFSEDGIVQKAFNWLGELDASELSAEFSRKWQRLAHGRVNEIVHMYHSNHQHLTSYTIMFDASTLLYRYSTVLVTLI